MKCTDVKCIQYNQCRHKDTAEYCALINETVNMPICDKQKDCLSKTVNGRCGRKDKICTI